MKHEKKLGKFTLTWTDTTEHNALYKVELTPGTIVFPGTTGGAIRNKATVFFEHSYDFAFGRWCDFILYMEKQPDTFEGLLTSSN